MYSRRTDEAKRGSALVGSLVVSVGLLGLMVATIAISSAEVKDAERAMADLRTRYVAEAGAERGLDFLNEAVAKTSIVGPLQGISGLFANEETIFPIIAESFMSDGAQVGAYTVTMSLVEETSSSITVELQTTGYVPDAPENLGPNERVQSWESVATTVRYELEPSNVFDYSYFINNWGWLYGSTIHVQGNARSNAQFDVAGYQPTITGQPLYDSIEWNGSTAQLIGYQDDNLDGLTDGNDGGIFSGWDIVGAHNVVGNGGLASNQHPFEDPIDMPNLTDLTQYEEIALDAGSSIVVGGTTMTDAVYGDDSGETGNLYLIGTAASPIELDGPVVVQGDVIISGYVTGQGAIYAGGNVVRAPTRSSTSRPRDDAADGQHPGQHRGLDHGQLGQGPAGTVRVGEHRRRRLHGLDLAVLRQRLDVVVLEPVGRGRGRGQPTEHGRRQGWHLRHGR